MVRLNKNGFNFYWNIYLAGIIIIFSRIIRGISFFLLLVNGLIRIINNNKLIKVNYYQCIRDKKEKASPREIGLAKEVVPSLALKLF
ncbi:hypothetical protein DJ58_2007 [Yersinia frederiksenii ATCC 33641]|uniref:Uncharacterized protein n=1 Tax=Yersinia frederiksenii ATCC 33641 TaxID=349966 RepID=A0ABR4W519_YERFR|nr:hypothetical protein CRN75_05550 [Yersinia frederiksenii]KGA47574.1 hypothetical protein DJ58_2007 [Yersinia frederiksenii ATCC 33641]